MDRPAVLSTFSLILHGCDPTTIARSAMIETPAIEHMSNASPDLEIPDLETLRRRIDEIDDRLQDLLIERMEIVSRVADSKQRGGGVAPHQPAREAEILRRLVARNSGALPAASLVRIWRELLAATTRMQGAFTIAVYVPQAGPGFWDIARDHYGSLAPMLTFGSATQVIRAVSEGRATVGVLPMPQEEEADPWWRHLLSGRGEAAPHVISRLPFGGRGNARSDGGAALAIGRGATLPTGSDRTLIATENARNISRGRLFSTLAGLDLRCTFIAASEHAEGGNTLIELDGFVPADDPRLDRFRAQLGAAVYRLLPLGGYAVPLSAAELSGAGLTGASENPAVTAGAAARG
jgi:chorismate mutase/prephenate dehydratase